MQAGWVLLLNPHPWQRPLGLAKQPQPALPTLLQHQCLQRPLVCVQVKSIATVEEGWQTRVTRSYFTFTHRGRPGAQAALQQQEVAAARYQPRSCPRLRDGTTVGCLEMLMTGRHHHLGVPPPRHTNGNSTLHRHRRLPRPRCPGKPAPSPSGPPPFLLSVVLAWLNCSHSPPGSSPEATLRHTASRRALKSTDAVQVSSSAAALAMRFHACRAEGGTAPRRPAQRHQQNPASLPGLQPSLHFLRPIPSVPNTPRATHPAPRNRAPARPPPGSLPHTPARALEPQPATRPLTAPASVRWAARFRCASGTCPGRPAWRGRARCSGSPCSACSC